jgi:AraC family transcriptional regulator of adaptative response / DNA-3-methyladenine glycosylase II
MSDFREPRRVRVEAGRMASTPSLTFDERYRAIDARDARFDGQFVTAVRSTGIYCRPSCPARTPSPRTSFYPTSAAAHEAGYRACKRCLPEAPGLARVEPAR